MLMLKLQRIGKKHQGSFRLIVGEKREKLNGKQLEDLGWYNPRSDKFEFKKERINYWMSKGAGKTDTVHNLLVTAGIIAGPKVAAHATPKKKEAEAAKPEAAKAEAAAPAPASTPAAA